MKSEEIIKINPMKIEHIADIRWMIKQNINVSFNDIAQIYNIDELQKELDIAANLNETQSDDNNRTCMTLYVENRLIGFFFTEVGRHGMHLLYPYVPNAPWEIAAKAAIIGYMENMARHHCKKYIFFYGTMRFDTISTYTAYAESFDFESKEIYDNSNLTELVIDVDGEKPSSLRFPFNLSRGMGLNVNKINTDVNKLKAFISLAPKFKADLEKEINEKHAVTLDRMNDMIDICQTANMLGDCNSDTIDGIFIWVINELEHTSLSICTDLDGNLLVIEPEEYSVLTEESLKAVYEKYIKYLTNQSLEELDYKQHICV